MKSNRHAGVLLHPTSFPSPNGIGELGAEAYQVLDWIAESGLTLWQVLPLGPTGYGDSPYASFSAFAGNPLLISLDSLVERGWLAADDLAVLRDLPPERVDYGTVVPTKKELLDRAFQAWNETSDEGERNRLNDFASAHASWLDDFAIFMALKRSFGGDSWNNWPEGLRDRHPEALAKAGEELAGSILREKWCQYIFFDQWSALHSRAAELGIAIIGDMPIFAAYDSADVWARRELFHLDENGAPTVVAGVPPDYFSPTGQRWGNPLYNWPSHEEEGFAWWKARFRTLLELVDMVRIDHFRGFDSYWEIPAEEITAVNGRWVDNVWGEKLFTSLREELGELPLIAEDLGNLSYGHTLELRERFGLPGMMVLQFAFGGKAENRYLPHNHERNGVVYTGTHDNPPVAGWWAESADDKIRKHVEEYLGHAIESPHRDFLRLAFGSVSKYAVAPMQDFLGLGMDGMMNRPGHAAGNWSWRLLPGSPRAEVASETRKMLELFGRLDAKEEEGGNGDS